MNLRIFQLQIVYSGLVFVILSVLKPSSFDVLAGIKGVVMVLGTTLFLISVPAFMLDVHKNLQNGNNLRNIKSVKVVLNLIIFLTIGFFIATICFAILSIVGVLRSNVSANTAYILLLVAPVWLSIRESVKNFIKQIES